MNTRDLLSRLPRHTEEGPLPESVTSLVHDSRSAGPGSLFVCLEGLSADGHAFARDAVDRGARLIVARRVPDPPAKAALVLVPDTREALARLAPAFHGDPSRQLTLVGVTGTNGKTTSTHFLTAIAEASGIRTGRIGTVGYDFAGRHINAPHTTPEAPVTNRLLREMLDHGVSFCAMEVSSHALDQRRAFGLDFAACLFTNLTQDHLDYHPDLEAYYQAKRRLFRAAERGGTRGGAVAAINIDDPAGRRLAGEADGPVVTFGTSEEARYRAVIRRLEPGGSRVDVETPSGPLALNVRMVGPFNVMNALGAACVMTELGFPAEQVVRGIESLRGVPGRMEKVDLGQPFQVIVDYAHTPDALERVLKAARAATPGRLIAVFGCGGDRDRKKRPIMGRLAAGLADHSIITSDNPRSEDPFAIVSEIEAGARQGGGRYETQVDRRTAIGMAVRSAGPGDAVVIAGKGHEPYQILADRTIHFDDREEAAGVLEALGYGGVHGV